MSRHGRRWFLGFVVLDAVLFALTVHAHLTFHHSSNANQPTTMTVGQLLGWVTSGLLLLALITVAVSSWRASREATGLNRR
jgi:heme/copper-type cytochrome/quinol oxidase subunit 3